MRPHASTTTWLIVVALAFALTGCSQVTSGLQSLTAQTNQVGTVEPPRVCPLPRLNHPAPKPPPPGPRDRWLGQPNLEDIAWSCSGRLYQWNGSGWTGLHLCRYTDHGQYASSQVVYIRRSGHHCNTAHIVFITEAVANRHFWYDPGIGGWFSTDNLGQTDLKGDTYCHQFQPIGDNGEPYLSKLKDCLRRHNAGTLTHLPSRSQLRQTMERWAPLYAGNRQSWSAISQAPLCREFFTRQACGLAA
jgi:hypothetical protein